MISNETIIKVEEDFLLTLANLLKTNTVSIYQARDLIREFLQQTPFHSMDDLHTKLKQFSSKHHLFHHVYLRFLKEKEVNQTNKILDSMKHYIN